MAQRSMTRFHLDTPYNSNNWPELSTNDQDTTLELLCSLLSPIGIHRQNHITPSKGKRDKKRKRNDDAATDLPKPPLPEIASQILIGFNSIIRHLQALCDVSEDDVRSGVEGGNPKVPYIAAIFATQPSSAQSILHSHFPLLTATASLSNPSKTPIRLVQLPRGCEGRLATVLGLPRVNFVAVLENAEGSGVLVDLVREKVPVLDDFALKRGEAMYREVQIVGVEGSVGVGRRERNLEKAKVPVK